MRVADERVVAAGVLAHEQQRVAQLQVVDGGRRAMPTYGLRDHGAAHQPASPTRRVGPQREVGLLAVGEVALVEQPDVARGTAAGRASACRADGRPAPTPRSTVAGARMPPKYGSTIGVAPSPKSAHASPARGRSVDGVEHPAAGSPAAAARRAARARPTPTSSVGAARKWRNPTLAPGPKPRLRAASSTTTSAPSTSRHVGRRVVDDDDRRPGRPGRGTPSTVSAQPLRLVPVDDDDRQGGRWRCWSR